MHANKMLKMILSPVLCIMLVLTMMMSSGSVLTAFASEDQYSITIQNSVLGQTYSVYKIFDATYSDNGAVSYTISSDSLLYEAIADDDSVFDLFKAPSGTYYVTAKDDVSDSDIIAFLESLDIPSILDPVISTDGSGAAVTLRPGNAGYYFITTTTGSVVSITTAHPTALIIDKNTTPAGSTFTKHIYEINEDGILEDHGTNVGDLSEGDEFEFVVKSYVPLFDGDRAVYEYQFEDDMTEGLVIEIPAEYVLDDGSIDTTALMNAWITLTGADADADAKFIDLVYDASLILKDVSTDAYGNVTASGFVLTYCTYDTSDDPVTQDSFINSKYPVNANIEIDYAACVTDAISHDDSNIAVVRWWDTGFEYPDIPEEPGTPSGEQTVHDDVYTWELAVLKLDGATQEVLEGAEFVLSGDNLNHVKVTSSVTYTPVGDDDDTDGVTLYYKLLNGTYTTAAPDAETEEEYDGTTAYTRTVGYTVEIHENDETHYAVGTSDDNGNIVFSGLSAGTYTLTETVAPDGYNLLQGSVTINIEYVAEEGTAGGYFTAAVEDADDYVMQDGVLTVTVNNVAGSVLPRTGGTGTNMLYAAGGAVLIAAVAVLALAFVKPMKKKAD